MHRPDLFFLNSTDMPALIPEIRRVHDYPDSENRAQGEALAEGTCAFLGHAFRAPHGPDTKPEPPHGTGTNPQPQPAAGLSFPDLKTAVRAHTGRLLAYALPSGTGSPAQNQLIDEALAARPLPPQLRGAAATLGGLAGTWAQDPRYGVKLAAVANAIRTDGS